MGDFLFIKCIRDRKNNVENFKYLQIFVRQVFSLFLLLIVEFEFFVVDLDVEVEVMIEIWFEVGLKWLIVFEEWGGVWEFYVYFFVLIFLGYVFYFVFFIVIGLYIGLK